MTTQMVNVPDGCGEPIAVVIPACDGALLDAYGEALLHRDRMRRIPLPGQVALARAEVTFDTLRAEVMNRVRS